MDCKDLMIGDWVKCNDLKRPVAVIGETVGFLDCNNQVYWAYEGFDRIDPIPLTEDILVKNGWDFTKRGYSVYCKEDTYGDVELSKDQDGFYWSINCDEYMILRIDYVHQLQHLLRLVGVQKEIEL